MTNQWYSPAKVYGQLYKEDKGNGIPEPITASDSKPSSKVSITESGEAVLVPDIARISISYKSVKDTVDAAKQSVQRRVDYMLQALRINGVKETQYTIHKYLERCGDQFQMLVEINVDFHDFQVCQTLCNFLIEKLDENVIISRPIFYHTPGKLDAARRLACVNAVKNARSKADAIAQFVNQRLGSAIEIKEENITEVTGESGHHEGANEFSIRARIAASTVTINVRISATFELEPKQKKKHR